MPDRDAVLARGRAAQEAVQLRSTVKIHHPTGRTTQDEDTGKEGPEYVEADADVPAKLVGKGSRNVQVGDVEYEQATALMHLPAAHRDLSDGDLFELTAGEWAGSFHRVIEAVQGDGQTARRIPVEHVDRPSTL